MKVSEVPIVENLLQLDVMLHDRVLDLCLKLKGEGKELGGRQVDFLILDRKLQIDEVLAELGVVFSCHEEGMLLQSILNDLESLPDLCGDPGCDTSLLRDLDLKGIHNSHNVSVLIEHVADKFDVLPFVRVVQRLDAGLCIEILNDLFELLPELILDVADSVKFWVKQAPEISDNLCGLIELLKHKVFFYALMQALCPLLESEQVPPYLSLMGLHLLLDLCLESLELLVRLGIYLMDLPQVAELLESPFEVRGVDDLTLA
jgi:hypothetical protein